MFKESKRYPELADPLLRGEFPIRSLNQAVAVAAMCLQEDAGVRPLMSDVVSALSFLGACPEVGTVTPYSFSSSPSESKAAESTREQELGNAMGWGSFSRLEASLSQRGSTSSL